MEAAALANAQRTLRRRTLRRTLIGHDEYFGEPAWEMLIDLFIHDCEGKAVSTSSLCIASGAPPTTALRLLHRLCEAGIVVRRRDMHDGRLQLTELAPELRHKLVAYFAAAAFDEK
ncbi:hypothetical protein ATE71_07490 [Sphingopyxis sp. H115]|nr:hypothetical protein ATE71_07490 [Sphingopyxis sp. H115]